jgi:hypothetical protein
MDALTRRREFLEGLGKTETEIGDRERDKIQQALTDWSDDKATYTLDKSNQKISYKCKSGPLNETNACHSAVFVKQRKIVLDKKPTIIYRVSI